MLQNTNNLSLKNTG
uniref:Uncharacterized protein n=1 Tax=Anguilla anguilla TaxID=7936 RepID=A0A0E9XSA2_ANGAN